MFDKPQATSVVGIEVDAFLLKGVALDLIRKKPHVKALFDLQLVPQSDESGVVKPLYTSEQKEQFTSLSDKYLFVTSMSMPYLLVRSLEMKLKKEKDIDAVLAFQTEPLLPYPIEEAVLDRLIISQDMGTSRLSILAVRKDHLTKHLTEWNDLDIEPEIVSADPQALAVFAHHTLTTEEPFCALHLGINKSLCILVENGKLIAAQAIPGGIENILLEYAQMMNINMYAAYQQLTTINIHEQNPKLQSAVEALQMMTTRTIYALAKQFKGKKVDSLLVTGSGANLSGLPELICKSLEKVLMIPNPDSIVGISVYDMHHYALPIGAALTALPLTYDQINYRQKEFAYPSPWKRLKKTLGIYFTLCVGIAIALTLFGKAYMSYQEAEIKVHYLELLNVMNKPYIEFEKEFSSKLTTIKGGASEEVLNIESLSNADISRRLQYLEKEIQATPQMFPLQPNVPTVSDVLAWISTHPQFVPSKSSANDQELSSLEIENFNYTMIRRPEPNKKQEKYQVKVEVEFSSPSPKMAREFHDALIAPNDIVDPKAEIKWNSNRNKYTTSFYLKDKTVYQSL